MNDSIAISYNHASRTGVPWRFASPSILVSVADVVRDHVVEDLWRAWPLCPHHGFALYPEVPRKVAVWGCRFQ